MNEPFRYRMRWLCTTGEADHFLQSLDAKDLISVIAVNNGIGVVYREKVPIDGIPTSEETQPLPD